MDKLNKTFVYEPEEFNFIYRQFSVESIISRTYAKTPYIAHNNFDELHYSHVRSPNYFYSKTFSFSSQITLILIEGCFN